MTTWCLGVSVSHNGSAVLLGDGELVVGIEKERLTRRKHEGGDETAAVRYCLDAAGITMSDVEVVVQNWFRPQLRGYHRLAPRYDGGEAYMFFGADPQALYAGARRGVVQVSHHLAHAWSAWGASPFEEAAVLVMDQCGNERRHLTDMAPSATDDPDHFHREVVSTYHAQGDALTPLTKVLSPVGWFTYGHALRFLNLGVGSLYAGVTRYCFDVFEDESGKVMALAPFGRSRPEGDAIPAFRDGEPLMSPDFAWTERFRNPMDLAGQGAEYESLCASAQAALERVVLRQARELHARTRSKNLCFAGGIALNCIANRKILDETGFERIFVQPAAHDGGIAVGCAAYAWRHVLGRGERVPMKRASLGRRYDDDDIVQALGRHPLLTARRVEQPWREAARRIADGALVGWYQGGSEFGPRALGHRSVLADPRRADTHAALNRRVKRRPDFQPYAPSVLAERCAEYFDLTHPSPFMLLAAQALPEVRAKIPAVVHIDGSSRVQTVAPGDGPYRALIEAFDALTGVPLVVNTSMNVKGEPIVESPEEALGFLIATGIDALFVGGWRVEREALSLERIAPLRPVWTPGTRLLLEPDPATDERRYLVQPRLSYRRALNLSRLAFGLLERVDGRATVRALLDAARPRNPFLAPRYDAWALALFEQLWVERLIDLRDPTAR